MLACSVWVCGWFKLMRLHHIFMLQIVIDVTWQHIPKYATHECIFMMIHAKNAWFLLNFQSRISYISFIYSFSEPKDFKLKFHIRKSKNESNFYYTIILFRKWFLTIIFQVENFPTFNLFRNEWQLTLINFQLVLIM